MNPELQAPGCFASPSIYAIDSQYCQQCVAYRECGEAMQKTLTELQPVINVKDLIDLHEKARKKMGIVREPEVAAVVETAFAASSPLPQAIERKTVVAKVDFEIDQKTMDLIANIGNVKAKAQALVLAKTNMIERAIVALSKGENPFINTPPRFLNVACDMLLNGGFTKASLKKALMERLGQSEGTAGSHVSIAVAMLQPMNIIVARGKTFTLNPAIRT
ncbi:hypothetical protein PQQ87_08185 [Paraburkholderia nemoris]|uniref:hypothetical protein n=1 Tax=Paraburkholderia nemoris TaxID=2793076 RepID=UPI0038BAE0BC